jgi:hypothetical protein
VLRFFKALVPHAILTSLGAFGGAVAGLVFDIEVLRGGGLGPAAAHAGRFVLFLLAAVPALLGLVAAYVGLGLSLGGAILWDALRRRWRRRTFVRLVVVLAGGWSWLDLISGAAPEGGWTILHYLVLLLVSLVMIAGGLIAGLVLSQFVVPKSEGSPQGDK